MVSWLYLGRTLYWQCKVYASIYINHVVFLIINIYLLFQLKKNYLFLSIRESKTMKIAWLINRHWTGDKLLKLSCFVVKMPVSLWLFLPSPISNIKAFTMD